MARKFLVTILLAIWTGSGAAFAPQLSQPATFRPLNPVQKQPTPFRPSASKPLKFADSAVMAGVDAFWQNFPYTAAALVCGLKACMADIVAQVREFKKSPEEKMADLPKATIKEKSSGSLFFRSADWKRNVAFVTYGGEFRLTRKASGLVIVKSYL